MHGLLFDLGGTFLRSGLASPCGAVCHRDKTRIASVADGLPPALIWQKITASILDYEAEHRHRLLPDAPVVISFPGPISASGRALQAPTVAGYDSASFDLPSAIERSTGRPVSVLNDVSAAAWRLAETTDAERFIVVTVSSGIGAKIFDRRHPDCVLDSPPYAGEIGHVVVDDSAAAPVCDCGGRGHLGAIASGRGVERLARQRALACPSCFEQSLAVRRFGATADSLSNERHIVPAVLARDPWLSAIVCDCTRPLVRSLLTVAMAAGLDKIFFIGGFANALGERYLEIVRALASELSRYAVVSAYLDGLFAGMRGAPETCLEGCGAFLRNARRSL